MKEMDTPDVITLLESNLNDLRQAGKMMETGLNQLVRLGACPAEDQSQLQARHAHIQTYADGFEAALRVVYEAHKESEET